MIRKLKPREEYLAMLKLLVGMEERDQLLNLVRKVAVDYQIDSIKNSEFLVALAYEVLMFVLRLQREKGTYDQSVR